MTALTVSDPDIYINECCWGGDIVRNRLLPLIGSGFEDVQTEQEDWGWFIWFRRGGVRLAVDIFCDDPTTGRFRIMLTGRKKRLLLLDSAADGPELDELRDLVYSYIAAWVGSCKVEKVSLP